MKIRRFVATDIGAAAAAVRRELGRDAVILSTRRLRASGWRWLLRRFDRIEVAAAVEDAAFDARPPARPATSAPRPAGDGAGLAGAMPLARARPKVTEALPAPGARPAARAPILDVREAPLQGVTRRELLEPTPAGPESQGQAPNLDVREAAPPVELRRAVFAQNLAPDLTGVPQPVLVRPGYRRLVALVGPTGAGKTTTLAKLAAQLHLQQGWRVALISADTFRVGATEQLAAYARLIGLPVEVTPTPGALGRALERLRDHEVVLIDTSGRAHRDGRRMKELQAYLEVARSVATGREAPPSGPGPHPGGLEVHLVLGMATRQAEVTAILAAYKPMADRLILTKLDECESSPDALAAAAAAGLPLSYCAAGQRVPEDLALAWPDRIAAGLGEGAFGPAAPGTPTGPGPE